MENSNENNSYSYLEEEEVHLQDYINVLFSPAQIVCVCLLCDLFRGSSLYFFSSARLYEAKATFACA